MYTRVLIDHKVMSFLMLLKDNILSKNIDVIFSSNSSIAVKFKQDAFCSNPKDCKVSCESKTKVYMKTVVADHSSFSLYTETHLAHGQ